MASVAMTPAAPRTQPGRHGNWTWDRQSAPPTTLAYDPPELSAAATLSEAAALLQAEWPIGAATDDYHYMSPYVGVDFSSTPTSTRRSRAPPAPSLSQPLRSSRPADIKRRRTDVPAASQDSEPPRVPATQSVPVAPTPTPPSMVQTQVERGRFASRPAKAAPRKKRMGGF